MGKPEAEALSGPMSNDQITLITAMLEKMNEQNQKNLMAAIAEIKKPTAEEQVKLDKEREKRSRMAHSRAEVGKMEKERREAQQRTCRHRRPDESWAVSGQNFSDGKGRLICLQCQKIVYEGAQFPQGVGPKVHLTGVN